MRPTTLPPRPAGNDPAQQIAWLTQCVITLAHNSQEEPARIFDSYASDVPATTTRALNVSAPTTQNLAQVLGSLIADWRARGVKRTQPT
jgi:hypothetical protein